MSIEPVIGMAIALFGVPILMVAVRFAGADPLRLVTRLAMWAMAAAVKGGDCCAGQFCPDLRGLVQRLISTARRRLFARSVATRPGQPYPLHKRQTWSDNAGRGCMARARLTTWRPVQHRHWAQTPTPATLQKRHRSP